MVTSPTRVRGRRKQLWGFLLGRTLSAAVRTGRDICPVPAPEPTWDVRGPSERTDLETPKQEVRFDTAENLSSPKDNVYCGSATRTCQTSRVLPGVNVTAHNSWCLKKTRLQRPRNFLKHPPPPLTSCPRLRVGSPCLRDPGCPLRPRSTSPLRLCRPNKAS